jgi:hypothetical protein
MKLFLFALVAIPVSDPTVGIQGSQTIGYYATIAECHTDRNRIEPTINKSYIKLDCIPVKVSEE